MPTFYFLSAAVPLTKTFTLNKAGELEKHPYPRVKNFTSHKVEADTLIQFHAALLKHAALGHCLLKGTIAKQLHNQPRAGSTKTETLTTWLCLDLDRAPFKTPKEFMASVPCLKNLSYIVQYSASHGLPETTGLSCHIFIQLNKPHHPDHIKAWLMHLNLDGDGDLRAALTLTRTNAYLHWPLDITTCQNDKLIYITPPTLGTGIKYSLTKTELIQLIPGSEPALNIALMVCDTVEKSRKAMRELINSLRKAAHIDPIRAQTKYIKEFEVQSKPGVATITGIKTDTDRGFVYFNINGGDSWGYFHPINNFELIHNFKGEPCYLTKEIFPEYYKQCRGERIAETVTPTDEGITVLGIRNRYTSKMHNVLWEPATHTLEVLPADNVKLLDDFLKGYGKPGLTETEQPIPTYTLGYDPQLPEGLDIDKKFINRFITTPLMRDKRKPAIDLSKCPTIEKVILSAVSGGEYNETAEHFFNWLAVILQHRVKTQTAWVLHGTFGTGKQLLINRILRPILGDANLTTRRASELEEKFTAWMEDKLLIFIDEIQVSASQRKDLISGDLKNFITDSPVTIRHMNRVSYEAPSFVNIIFGSNMADPVVVEKEDRRYNVGVYQRKRLRMTVQEAEIQLQAELPFFCNYIMTRAADRYTAAQVIDTQARRDVITANRNSIDMVCDAITDGDFDFLYDSLPDPRLLSDLHGINSVLPAAYTALIKREAESLIKYGRKTKSGICMDSKLNRDELNIIFQHCIGGIATSPNKFTRLLKHHGIEMKKIRQGDVTTTGLEPIWKVSEKWIAEHKAEFVETKLRRVK